MTDPLVPRQGQVKCLSPVGFHSIRYTEWGEAANPRVVLCVHGLTRMGSDFNRLARALAPDRRVVCVDVVGRGHSDRLRDPNYYTIPQYVADMTTLIARLDVAELDWVGTSMGGLIGMGVAGQPESPIRRLVLNDVGPKIDAAAIERIGMYVGQPVSFGNLEEAVDFVSTVAAPFGLKSRDDWRELVAPTIRQEGERWVLRYDPRIAIPFKAATPQSTAAAEAVMWGLYDRITAPTLVLRGALSDLLSRETLAAMAERGPRAETKEFEGIGHAPTLMFPNEIEAVRAFLMRP